MSKGCFLALGGIGGTGKTSLTLKISEFFNAHDIPTVLTYEPGGTPAANHLRQLCREGIPNAEPLTPMAEALLFTAARAQHVEQIIKPALEAGRVVVCDRYVETTYAYQGAMRGASIFSLEQVHHHAIGVNPDLTLILYGDVQVFMDRVSEKEKGSDKFDRLGYDAQNRAQDFLIRLAKSDPQRYILIEADGSPERVWAQVLPYLEKIRISRIRNIILEEGIKDTAPSTDAMINSILRPRLPEPPPMPKEPEWTVDKNYLGSV